MNGFSQNNVTPYLIRGAVIPILSIRFIDVKLLRRGAPMTIPQTGYA